MANYRVDRNETLIGSLFITATGSEADGETIFMGFQEAKAAAMGIIDNEIAKLHNRRKEIRSMKVKDVKLEAK